MELNYIYIYIYIYITDLLFNLRENEESGGEVEKFPSHSFLHCCGLEL